MVLSFDPKPIEVIRIIGDNPIYPLLIIWLISDLNGLRRNVFVSRAIGMGLVLTQTTGNK